MPYVFVEVLDEGMEEADVVERSELDNAITERDAAREQRDQAIERADKAETDLTAQKEKYANTFLSRSRQKPKHEGDAKPAHTLDTFKIGGWF